MRQHFYDESRRVRQMLTYLASALGCITSPAARLLALQCALRADTHGCARLPASLLSSMRMHRRAEVWQELAVDGWLDLPTTRAAFMHVRLLDAAILDQAPGRRGRRRAAHWALQPSPLPMPPALASAERLTALVLAAHSDSSGTAADLAVVARLCGHSRQQTGELLDRLVARRTLAAGTINQTPTRCTGSLNHVTDSPYVPQIVQHPDPAPWQSPPLNPSRTAENYATVFRTIATTKHVRQ